MIRNIVFDMGQVLLRFDPPLFIERAGVPEADRELVRREHAVSIAFELIERFRKGEL